MQWSCKSSDSFLSLLFNAAKANNLTVANAMFGEVLTVNPAGKSALLIRAKGCTDGETTDGVLVRNNVRTTTTVSVGEPFTPTIKKPELNHAP